MMQPDNYITDIEQTLKQLLEDKNNIQLNDQAVPVKVVTPDPDFEQMELPCITIELTDIKQDFERSSYDRCIDKDMQTMTAKVRPGSLPYNLYYTISTHTDKTREDRLLFGDLLYFFDNNKMLISRVFKKALYVERELEFSDSSKARQTVKSIDLVIKTRVEAKEAVIKSIVNKKLISTKTI